MRKIIRLQGMAGAIIFAMIAAAGCSTDNPTTPFVGGTANGISVDLPGNGVANFEELEVCKEWTNNGNSSSTDIDVTVADPGQAGTTTTHTLAAGQCRLVAQFDGSTAGPADLTTTETVPANATLDSIVVVTIDRTSGSTVTTTDVLTGTGTWSFADAANKYGFLVTYWNTLAPPEGGEGCTPGYWKQSHHFDSWPSAYTQSDSYDAVFGVTSSFGGTLLQALKRGGGKENALGRHATAALLNAASSVNYAFTEAQVIQTVQNAYASGDFNGAKDELATENERGCPLN